jgi:hypothetical protein
MGGKRMADLPMQGAGGKAQPTRCAQIRHGRFQAVQSPGNTGFLLGEGRAFRECIGNNGKAFRRRITKLDDTFGINAIAFGAKRDQRDLLGGVIAGVGDARGKCRNERSFLSGIVAEDHHRAPAEGEGVDGGGDGHRVRHGGAAGAKAAMVQPFAEDHGAGAQQGPRRPIRLAQGGISRGARRFLHAMNLVNL